MIKRLQSTAVATLGPLFARPRRKQVAALCLRRKGRRVEVLMITSRGTGHRVDLYACVLQLFMILALVPIAGTIADTIMTNVFAERRHYQEYKNEMTPDFSDVRAKVEQLEQQTQATQQKMLDYGED